MNPLLTNLKLEYEPGSVDGHGGYLVLEADGAELVAPPVVVLVRVGVVLRQLERLPHVELREVQHDLLTRRGLQNPAAENGDREALGEARGVDEAPVVGDGSPAVVDLLRVQRGRVLVRVG